MHGPRFYTGRLDLEVPLLRGNLEIVCRSFLDAVVPLELQDHLIGFSSPGWIYRFTAAVIAWVPEDRIVRLSYENQVARTPCPLCGDSPNQLPGFTMRHSLPQHLRHEGTVAKCSVTEAAQILIRLIEDQEDEREIRDRKR